MLLKHVHKIILLICVFQIMSSCYKEIIVPTEEPLFEYELKFNELMVAIDLSRKHILCPVTNLDREAWNVEFSSYGVTVMMVNGIQVISQTFQFKNIQCNDSNQIRLQFPDGTTDDFILQFTTLPVVQIFTEGDIMDDPKIPAWFIISDGSTEAYRMDIEKRGASNLSRPKGAFNIEFTEPKNISFFGLMPDDDWILDAMYIDKARMRNVLSFKIWNEMQSSSLGEFNLKTTGIKGGYVEVFVNNSFQGIYHLCERIDRKRLDIIKSQNSLEGLIYKACEWDDATVYKKIPPSETTIEWAGWKLEYPDELVAVAWTPLVNYLNFAVYSEAGDFEDHIFSYINMNSAIDYYILLNLVKGLDNTGKNIIMTRYSNQSPFIFIPWDLDGTWGRGWDSSFVSYDGILTNGLYDRLLELNPSGFKELMAERWHEVYQQFSGGDVISGYIDEIAQEFEQSGAYEREKWLWPEWNLQLEEEAGYMKAWTYSRMEYLNEYFNGLVEH